ncbi:MAG: hypothetical protein WDN69_01900 [Aliidongia sp.]
MTRVSEFRSAQTTLRRLLPAGLILAGLLGATQAGAQSITEFPIPTPGLLPAGITAGPDGALWFAGGVGTPAMIGRIATNGTVTEFPLPAPGKAPTGFGNVNSLTTGPDGALWFTTSETQIGRITTAGAVTGFTTPSADASTLGITTGPDGALWFTEGFGGAVGRIATDGTITEFSTGTRGSIAAGIATGSDGNLWFTDPGLGAIGRITTTGTVTYFPLPNGADSTPGSIVAGPDGNVWFTQLGSVGRITPAGTITDFPASISGFEPAGLVVGPDAALWFTDMGNNAVGRVTTDGVYGEAPLPTASGFTAGNLLNQIAAGPDGALWFVESLAAQIGRDQIVPSPLVAAVLPSGRSVETGTTATVFATMINSGSASLSGCAIGIAGSAAAIQGGLTLTYQTTDPTTNAPTGTPNTPATIAGQGGAQTFVLSFADANPLAEQTLPLDFDCSGVESAALVTGVNTIDLGFSSTPVPDVIALAATATNDQTVHLANGIGAFALASEDVGAAGALTLEADTGDATLPVTLSLCQTNAAGQCQAAPTASLPVNFSAGSVPTFSVFVSASADIPFAPGASRIFVRFEDASGATHGSTSVAVTTD